MGFLADSTKQSVYVEVKGEPVTLRPLSAKPQTVWVHKIQEVKTAGPNGQPQTVRKFAYETCTATNRSGAGCYLCSTPDPLWSMLSGEEQTNRQGKRVDFPKTPIHMLPVYNHSTMQAEVLKGGNQIFQEMDKWFDTQDTRGQDLRRCDWRVWKTGERKMTRYNSLRLDASAFDVTPELEDQAKSVLTVAMRDRAPTDTPKLVAAIRGGDGSTALPEGNTQAQYGLPAGQAQFQLPQSNNPAVFMNGAAGIANVIANAVAGAPMTAPVAAAAPTPVAAPKLPIVNAATPNVEVKAVNGDQASKNVVDAFSSWLNSQPEFQGMGMIQTLLPILKKEVGHAEYYKLSEHQLETLRMALESKLGEMRGARG